MAEESATLKALEKEAERRRKEATDKANVPLPSPIKEIVSTSVTYTVDPRILPFSLVDGKRLTEVLNDKFRLTFKLPEVNAEAMRMLGLESQNLTEESLLRVVLKAANPQLLFENGRYPTGPSSFVPIEYIAFTRENIIVRVSGVTEVAEVVAADSFGALWESTGALQNWDSPDVQGKVQMISFSTTTKVDVGTGVRSFLNPALCSYLDSNVNEGAKLASKMNTYSRYDGFKPSDSMMGSWSFEEMYINVHSFDSTTGLAETSKLHIDTQTKDERGRGMINLSSSLPFDDHVKMVEEIVNGLKEQSKK